MIVVDTSVLIEHIRGRKAATRLLEKEAEAGVLVPTLVAWELWKGARTTAEEAAVTLVLDAGQSDPFVPAMARIAGRLHVEERKRGSERPALDLLIASHAIYHGCRLATCDADMDGTVGVDVVRVGSR